MARASFFVFASSSIAALAKATTSVLDSALQADDECAAGVSAEACGLSALQVKARRHEKERGEGFQCSGAFCDDLEAWADEFDTMDPAKMQKALDDNAEFASDKEGITMAVTKDKFYEMYHGNVKNKLSQYLPQKIFLWQFDQKFNTVSENATDATVVRDGLISFHMGWWKRSMFWRYAVHGLPKGEKFPYTEVKTFDDCTDCEAKMQISLKKGGLTNSTDRWKVTNIDVIKIS